MSGYRLEYKEIKMKSSDQSRWYTSDDVCDGLDRAIKHWKEGDKLVSLDPGDNPYYLPDEDLDRLESYYKEMLTKIEQFKNSRKENKS